MTGVLDLIVLAIVALVATALIAALLAPLESLGWWAGWFGNEDVAADTRRKLEAATAAPRTPPHAVEHYLVYLSGIGSISGKEQLPTEPGFVARLTERLPQTTVIDSVFPYSVAGFGLTDMRGSAGFWQWLQRFRSARPQSVLGFAINIRNLFQVVVSADRRYGPIYNLGMAKEVLLALVRNGYQIGSGTPVTLLGWSGGAQIAIAMVPFLAAELNAPVRVISLGGVMAGERGILYATDVQHLYGSRDSVPGLGKIMFPTRWVWARHTFWNKAVAAGRFHEHDIGAMAHMGAGGYLDPDTILDDGRSCVATSVDAICGVLSAAGVTVVATSPTTTPTGSAEPATPPPTPTTATPR